MTLKIGTHSGPFHADDAFAVAILIMALGHAGYTITRSRDPQILAALDVLVDVGGEYNLVERRFDHHFANPPLHPESGEKLASAGLVWLEYGHLIALAPEVTRSVYNSLIRPIDAYDTGSLESKGHYTVSNMISALNPEWDDPDQDFDGQFAIAVSVAMRALKAEVRRAWAKVKAKDIAHVAIATADGAPIVVTEKFAPIMDELITKTSALFWVYPGPGGDCWMVQAVPPSRGSFNQRRPLLAAWAGLRDEELQVASGVADAVFVHPGQFIGGAKTREGAMAIARGSIPLCV